MIPPSKLVSIIVPCFNQAQFLDETLQSVLDQTYTQWECIIVNDGSTDTTKEIAENWCRTDDRFFYYYKDNGGLSSARNYGIRKATGDCIQFLDSDDLLAPNKLETQLLDLNESDISVSNYFPFVHKTDAYEPKRYLSPFLSEAYFKKEVILDWEYRKSIPCHAVLFKKALIDEVQLKFDEELPNHEDWVFWVQLFYRAKGIKNNNQELALYRIHGNSMSVDYKVMKLGFLKAAKRLEAFFKTHNDTVFVNITKQKYKEIENRGRTPFFKKLQKKVRSTLARYYNYARKN